MEKSMAMDKRQTLQNLKTLHVWPDLIKKATTQFQEKFLIDP